MNKNIVKIIESGYSVNIKSDYRDSKKINAYVPTVKNIQLLEKFIKSIVNQKSSSFILSGAYGTGKSYFTSVLINLLSDAYDYEKIEDLMININEKYLFEKSLKKIEKNEYLIVFAEDVYNDFKKSVSIGINKVIKQNNLDIKLNTEYALIKNKINNWERNYSEIFDKFIKSLKQNKITYDEFMNKLEVYDRKSYDFFIEIYPQLFAGEEYTELTATKNIQELLENFEEKVINETKYKGIIYIFDEFGRYLETNIESIDVKEVQDMAEYCNGENNSSLLLITHKDIFQYTGKLGRKKDINEWEKVSGRFKKEHLSFEKNNVLSLVSNMLRKDKKLLEELKEKNKTKLNRYYKNLKITKYKSSNDEELFNKYYPLNYLTAYVLPDLSQKVAQNERSLFAFISGNEKYSLRNLIEKKDFLISLDSLYDYFYENFKYLPYEGNEYKTFINSINIISKLDKIKEKLEIKLVKIITIIYIYNRFSDLEPTKEVLKLALNTSKNIEDIYRTLENKNLVIYRRHYNHYKLAEEIDVNLDKEVRKYIEENLQKYDIVETLKKHVPLETYYPMKYNDENKIIRYFKQYYLDVSNLKELDTIINSIKEDGKIIYLLNSEMNEKFEEIKVNLLNGKLKDVFVFSNKSNKKNKLYSLTRELEALDRIYLGDAKYRKEGVLKNEIDSYREELISAISKILKNHFSLKNADLFIDGNKVKKLKTKVDFIIKSSEYLEKKYFKYIPINYELINKTTITSPMKKARKEILLKVESGVLMNSDFYKEYTSRSTAESTLGRILLNNIFDVKTNKFRENYLGLYKEILEKIKIKVGISELLEEYCSNKSEYGLRKSIFIFIIGLVFILHKEELNISDSSNTQLDYSLDLLSEIELKPENYYISYIEYSKIEKLYFDGLEEILHAYLSESSSNRAINILNSLKNYVYELPKVIINEVSKERKGFNKILKGILTEKNATEYLLKELPKKYKTDDYSKVLNLLQEDINYFDKYINSVEEEIKNYILKILSSSKSSLSEAYSDWKNKNKIYDSEIKKWLEKYKYHSDKQLMKDFTKKIQGFNYYNWYSSKDFESFYEKMIIEIKPKEKKSEDTYIDSLIINGKEFLIESNEKVSPIAKVLKTKLKADIKNIGITVDEDTKRKILLELLLEV